MLRNRAKERVSSKINKRRFRKGGKEKKRKEKKRKEKKGGNG
jgi:hypothetical protein